MVMGIRAGENKDDASLPMFSDDILKVEISGPDVSQNLPFPMIVVGPAKLTAMQQPHLTVIDVPGLFQVTGDAGKQQQRRSENETWRFC